MLRPYYDTYEIKNAMEGPSDGKNLFLRHRETLEKRFLLSPI